MKIRRAPLEFNHVLTANVQCAPQDWYASAQEFRNQVIKNSLYATGPFIYQVDMIEDGKEKAEFTFHIPVNAIVEIKENGMYSFSERMRIDDGFVYRHADIDEPMDEAYALLFACAQHHNVKLHVPFYHIYLDVYGGGIIDIYAPIMKEDNYDQSE